MVTDQFLLDQTPLQLDREGIKVLKRRWREGGWQGVGDYSREVIILNISI